MKRRHNMPFGAECREDGAVRLRLWAPGARQAALLLDTGDGSSRNFPIDRNGAGWFEFITDAARAGTLYQFRINDAQNVPDPASRFQPRDVHGPSEVINPDS